jgi:hypothetical protein
VRHFRGATFNIRYNRGNTFAVVVDGAAIEGNIVRGIEAGKTYSVDVTIV